jgi:suppressor of ftsI
MMGGMMMGSPSPDGIEWEDTDMAMMNQMATKDMTKWNIVDTETGKKNMDINWSFKAGDKVKVRITNDEKSAHPMQHPIHFHGQRFLVVNENGTVNDNLVWKDTVMVPAGQYVDILLDTTNPGDWMAHCHIAEHLEAGMMFEFKVE